MENSARSRTDEDQAGDRPYEDDEDHADQLANGGRPFRDEGAEVVYPRPEDERGDHRRHSEDQHSREQVGERLTTESQANQQAEHRKKVG